ncbi:MAG: Na+/H+ antiporter subunit G [Rubrimonas sp.]
MVLIEIVVAAMLVVGGVFGFVGSFGLIKLPDLMTRLHAPTKATTLGVGGVLLGSMVHFAAIEGKFSLHEVLVTLFLFLTAPITANMIAKAWLHRDGADTRIPPTGTGCGWANDQAPREPNEPAAGHDAR